MNNTTKSKIQAVVFAGGHGNRMINLTEQIEKPLLLIGNMPLFWYPLNMLSRNSISDVLLITNEMCDEKIRAYLKPGELPPLPNLNIKIILLDSKIDENVDQWGTADVLRYISTKYLKPSHDLLLVSGDIVSDLLLDGMLLHHYEQNSFLTCAFTDTLLNGPVPGPKTHKRYRDFSIIIPETSQLLFLSEEEDFDQDENFDSKLFKKFSKVTLTSSYKDCHIYLINSHVIDIINDDINESFASVKADLIPYLLECQYNENKQSLDEILELNDSFKCFAYRLTTKDCSFLAQCNTISSYFEASKTIQRILEKICNPNKLEFINLQTLNLKTCNIKESLISNINTGFGEKVTIKKSYIGPNCIIESNVKIENSVLFSNVRVHNNVVIKDSIIFPNCKLNEKSEVNMSIIGKDQSVNHREKLAFTILRTEKEMNLEDLCL